MLTPYILLDACLYTVSLAVAKVRTGSFRTCSFLIEGSNPFLKTIIFSRSQAKLSADCVDGVVRFGSANSRVKTLLIRRIS